jgi:dipeptidyl-peptidase-4
MNVVSHYKFSPKGNYISYLLSCKESLKNDLWIYNLKSKKHKLILSSDYGLKEIDTLTTDQQLARERAREVRLGILTYSWSPDGSSILVESNNKLILVSTKDSQTIWISECENPVSLATFSPDGKKIAFVQNGDLWCLFLSNEGLPEIPAKRLTSDSRDNYFYGVADQITWEELGRQRGFWWLPNSSEIILSAVRIDDLSTVYISNSDQSVEAYKYSFPGEEIPSNEMLIIDVDSGKREDLNFLKFDKSYLVDVVVYSGGDILFVELSRKQTEVTVYKLKQERDSVDKLFSEQGYPWINVFETIHFVSDTNCFVWVGDGGDTSQLERRDINGNFLNKISTPKGTFFRKILGIDSEKQLVYYVASGDDPREQHIFCSHIEDGSEAQQITSELGCHTAVISPNGKTWIHQYDSVQTPPKVVFEEVLGSKIYEIFPHDCRDIESLSLRPPELLSFLSEDGSTTLYGALYHPQVNAIDKTSQLPPLVISVYGGPRHQAVQNSWRLTADLRAQHFSQKGYFVLKVDNRGTWGRGKRFESAIHHRLGHIEVEDQVRGVNFITADLGLADPSRVGIYGWSYGGYLSAMCLLKKPHIFHVAVAGAPVIQWDDYDAIYTERYMGVPSARENCLNSDLNPLGYQQSSVLSYLDKLSKNLLVIHGTKDENVLLRHTIALLEKGIKLAKHIDLLLLPNERHRVRQYENMVHLERELFGYIDSNLE